MRAGKTVFRKIGNFILAVSAGPEHFNGLSVHVPFQLRFRQRQLAAFQLPEKRGPFLRNQPVGADVRRVKPDRGMQRLFPVLHGLPGNPEDQVQVQVFDSVPGCQGGGFLHFAEGMDPPQRLQQPVLKGLHSKGKPVDAEALHGPDKRFGQGAGIRFDGKFGDGSEGNSFVNSLHQARKLRGGKQGRRSAADEHRFYRLRKFADPPVRFTEQRFGIDFLLYF